MGQKMLKQRGTGHVASFWLLPGGLVDRTGPSRRSNKPLISMNYKQRLRAVSTPFVYPFQRSKKRCHWKMKGEGI